MLVWIAPKLSINIFCPHWENLSATIQNTLTDFQLLLDSSSEILVNKSKCAIFVRTIILNTRLQSWKIFPPYLFLWSICFQCDWIFFSFLPPLGCHGFPADRLFTTATKTHILMLGFLPGEKYSSSAEYSGPQTHRSSSERTKAMSDFLIKPYS